MMKRLTITTDEAGMRAIMGAVLKISADMTIETVKDEPVPPRKVNRLRGTTSADKVLERLAMFPNGLTHEAIWAHLATFGFALNTARATISRLHATHKIVTIGNHIRLAG